MLLSIHHSMIITANHAISPPNRPYQKPVYKNGRWINASVAPTSFITTISSYLFKIFRRMVLPIISTTAMKSSNPISVTKSLAISITAYKRSNHSISSLPISTSRCCHSLSSSAFAAVGDACFSFGVTSTTSGSGFFSR